MRKTVFFIGIILLLGTSLCFAQAEEITITTYYPSPYGVYNKLTMSTLGVGDIDGDGSPDDDDAPDPATNDGDVWIGGNVGIGTTSPSANLHIVDSGAAYLTLASTGGVPRLSILASSNDEEAMLRFQVGGYWWSVGANYDDAEKFTIAQNSGFNNPAFNLFTITKSGEFGIKTTSPAYELDVNGDLRITGTPYRNAGDIAWQVPSDERLKDVLGDYEYGLMEIAKINPVRFKFKQDNSLNLTSDKEYVGIIAQEVQKVIPEAVSEEENGYLTLNSSPVIWAMLNAIKQQQKQIDGLKLKIEELEMQLSIR